MEEINLQDYCFFSGVQKLVFLLEFCMFNIVLFIKNFLVVIYEFKQVCQFCYFKIGFWVGDYIYCEGFEYKCKWDILFGWFWSLEDQIWKWIWFWFIKISFVGFYYLCKDMINKQDCKYGDNCIFVYYQEEIDVWIEEWKGIFNCDLFFDLLGGVKCGSFIIVKFLKEYQGIFIFFCEICFDSKFWIISKGIKDFLFVCFNLVVKYSFYNNKCLVYIVCFIFFKYFKICQFQEYFQFDVCCYEVCYGCLWEDSCYFVYSFIEFKVWLLQQYLGMIYEDIVQEFKKYWQQMEVYVGKVSSSMGVLRIYGFSIFDLQMKFVCGQCWRNGQVVEFDKDFKYCSVKVWYCWIKEWWVFLVMFKVKRKWVLVRLLLFICNFLQ